MGGSASAPGGEREYQDQSLEVPWSIPVRSDISGQPQIAPDAQERESAETDSESAETDSARNQEQDVTPAETAEVPATAPPRSSEVASTPLRRSSRGRRAPDRLIESI